MNQVSPTKEKILDTAERLIANQGFAATSLRQIIAEAQVNLAAVHYHFGSKQELLDELICRKAAHVNSQRDALLERFERGEGTRPMTVEKILRAFFEPMIEAGEQNPQFVRLMGRMIAEGMIPAIVEKHFGLHRSGGMEYAVLSAEGLSGSHSRHSWRSGRLAR